MIEDKNTKTMGDDVFYTIPKIMDFFFSIKAFVCANNLYIEHSVIEKLTIYAYCWYLGLKGKRLFREGITAVHTGFFLLTYRRGMLQSYDKPELSDEVKVFLRNIWACYSRFGHAHLSMLQSREVEYIYKMCKCNGSVDRVDDEMIEKFYSYNNDAIADLLPEGVVIRLDDEGIPEIFRLNQETFYAIEEVEEW